MKLLYLNHNIVGSGTYQRAFQLGRELAQRGYDITLVTTSRNRRLTATEHERSGVRVIEAPDLLTGAARNGWDAWNATWRTHRLAREEFDLIHAFDCRPAVILPALAQRQRNAAPLFLDWADWWGRGGTISERSGWAVRTLFGPVETWFEEHFRAAATANTTISEPLRQRCIALGVPQERVVALPNGCEPPATEVAAGRALARQQLHVRDVPLVLHLGVMQRNAAQLLFDAFRMLRTQLPNVRLAIIGNFAGPVPPDLRQAVTRTGYVDNETLQYWLAAADIGVIPLRDTLASRARWPGKINEYFTAGLPVVLPRVGAAASYVETHSAGATCGADAASFATTMARVLQDEAARARMRTRARELAAGELAWSRIANSLTTFYSRSTTATRVALPLRVSAGAT